FEDHPRGAGSSFQKFEKSQMTEDARQSDAIAAGAHYQLTFFEGDPRFGIVALDELLAAETVQQLRQRGSIVDLERNGDALDKQRPTGAIVTQLLGQQTSSVERASQCPVGRYRSSERQGGAESIAGVRCIFTCQPERP